MTTLTAPTPLAGRVTRSRVIRSEWTKFRSVRSTGWSLAAALVLTIGIGTLVSLVAATQTHPATDSFNVAGRSEIGNLLSQLVVAVLAVLMITGEYGTGMIRSSMSVVPRRLPVLWGKIAVFVAAALPVLTVASLAAFELGQLVWRAKGQPAVGLGDPGVARIVFGSALALVVTGVLSLAIGALVRSTAAGITVVVGLLFVVPTLMAALPTGIANYSRFLPSNAGGALWHEALSERVMSPWSGFALLVAYTVVLVALAARRMRRRDV
jgi:ABC-2 type transport system permease protein